MASPDQAELVTIGRIERSFGVRGEARVRSLSDVPGRFEALRQVTIAGSGGKTLETVVTHAEDFSKPPEETRRRCRPINIINVT
jgi:16S rRNA processing protein RimM